jgi:alpha-acetolactate decarboxylase
MLDGLFYQCESDGALEETDDDKSEYAVTVSQWKKLTVRGIERIEEGGRRTW